jgi:hypothetical protein
MDIRRIYLIVSLLFCTFCSCAAASQQPAVDSTGLPGDHFNLDGALDLFKSSANLSDFEQRLNTESNYVNNLDLNEDGEVDYVKVVEYHEDNIRTVVLQVAITETESQDVAVIEIEKNGEESAVLQIAGDPDLYGEEQIIEPAEATVASQQTVVVNVWHWPSVRYIYAPGYVVYRPAWRWRYYPPYFRPWRARPFRVYYYHPRPYRASYKVVRVRRVVNAPRIYRPYRTTSVTVRTRYPAAKTHKTVIRNTTNVQVNKTTRVRKTNAVQPRSGNVRGRRTGTTKTVQTRSQRTVSTKTVKKKK